MGIGTGKDVGRASLELRVWFDPQVSLPIATYEANRADLRVRVRTRVRVRPTELLGLTFIFAEPSRYVLYMDVHSHILIWSGTDVMGDEFEVIQTLALP